jgi:hypothetical protein
MVYTKSLARVSYSTAECHAVTHRARWVRLRLVNDPSIDSILALMIITLGGTMRHIVGFETWPRSRRRPLSVISDNGPISQESCGSVSQALLPEKAGHRVADGMIMARDVIAGKFTASFN